LVLLSRQGAKAAKIERISQGISPWVVPAFTPKFIWISRQGAEFAKAEGKFYRKVSLVLWFLHLDYFAPFAPLREKSFCSISAVLTGSARD
jgi:hypothetical protein